MAAWKGPSGASTRRAWDERIAGQWQRPRVLTWHHPRASSLKMLGLSLWEGRLPGQKTIENEDKAAMGSYRPESNFGTSDTVTIPARFRAQGASSTCTDSILIVPHCFLLLQVCPAARCDPLGP